MINGSIPGPTIEAFVGDELSVTVRNRFYIEGASIHWHGLHQRGTNFFDGVDGVTQCPIPHGTDFTYRFKLDCAGMPVHIDVTMQIS